MARLRQPPLHFELLGDGREMLGEVGKVEYRNSRGIELHPHQEDSDSASACSSAWRMFPLWRKTKSAIAGHQSTSVGAADQQDGGVLHGLVAEVPPGSFLFQSPSKSPSPRSRRNRPVNPAPGWVPEPQSTDFRSACDIVPSRAVGPHGEELVERKFAVEDVAAGQAVGLFQVLRRDDLVCQDQLRQIRRVLRKCLDHGFAQRYRAGSPNRCPSICRARTACRWTSRACPRERARDRSAKGSRLPDRAAARSCHTSIRRTPAPGNRSQGRCECVP